MAFRCLVLCGDTSALPTLSRIFAELHIDPEVCGDASAALNRLSHQHYEALVVDCGLRDGTLVLEEVHKTASNKTSVAFAILSDNISSTEAQKRGAHFLLRKPLTVDAAMRTFRAGFGMIVREKRRYFRCPVEMPVKLERKGEQVPARGTNLSEGGMAIQAASTMPASGDVRLRFSLAEVSAVIQSDGKIQWAGPHGEAGIEFLHMPHAARVELESWLEQRLEEEEGLDQFGKRVTRNRQIPKV